MPRLCCTANVHANIFLSKFFLHFYVINVVQLGVPRHILCAFMQICMHIPAHSCSPMWSVHSTSTCFVLYISVLLIPRIMFNNQPVNVHRYTRKFWLICDFNDKACFFTFFRWRVKPFLLQLRPNWRPLKAPSSILNILHHRKKKKDDRQNLF